MYCEDDVSVRGRRGQRPSFAVVAEGRYELAQTEVCGDAQPHRKSGREMLKGTKGQDRTQAQMLASIAIMNAGKCRARTKRIVMVANENNKKLARASRAAGVRGGVRVRVRRFI